MNKKRFLTREYEKTDFHPLLSEFMEMATWTAQCRFPENFRGLMAYFIEGGLKDSYGINYFWIDDSEKETLSYRTKENRLRDMLYDCSYQIANSVQALGGLDGGYKLKKPDYSELDHLEKILKKIYPDSNMINQLTFHFLEEQIFNDSIIRPENIFYYEQKTWLETIDKAVKFANTLSSNIDQTASLMTKALAIEGIKSLVL